MLFEDPVLDLLEFGAQCLENRKVTVDDIIDECIQHESRALLQQMRLVFATRPDILEAEARPVAHGKHVVGTDEYIDFPNQQFVIAIHLDRVKYREQRFPVFFDLRSLVSVADVLECQLVQAEFMFHDIEFAGVRILQCDPNEAFRFGKVNTDVIDMDIGELFAVLVDDAIDYHGGNRKVAWNVLKGTSSVARRVPPSAEHIPCNVPGDSSLFDENRML